MKKQTIIILTLLTLITIINANPYTDNKPNNIWEERFQQILAQQQIQKAEFEKLKKNVTEEVFYHEYGDAFERYAEVIVENAGLFTISVKAPEQLKVGEKAIISFRLGNMFNKGYFGINEILDENLNLMQRGKIENGLLSFIVPQGKIYVDYDNIELTYFQHAIDVVPHNLNTPKKILRRNNINAFDAETTTDYFVMNYFKIFEHKELGRYEKATKEVLENILDELVSLTVGLIPYGSNVYTLLKIPSPWIGAWLEDITENKIAIEKAKLDLLKMLAKDRNEYNIFDVPIVLNEKVVGTEEPIMAMIINIPIEIKEPFEPGDKMGFYFDGCLGEEQDLERSEYFEWDLNEWESLSSNDDVEENMELVEGGTFMMGDTWGDGFSDEYPVHEVNLTYDYYMGKYEVTNGEYVEFLNSAGVASDGSKDGIRYIDIAFNYCNIEYRNGRFMLKESGKVNYPVIEVTWYGAVAYCNWLSWQKGLPEAYEWDSGQNTYRLSDYPNNTGYRLPTEAEWEYAARGGQSYKYAGSDDLDEVGWYDGNSQNARYAIFSGRGTQEAGQKKANGYGLYDMSGNVYEWCSDNWYDYPDYTDTNPYYQKPENTGSSDRVIRGGSWYHFAYSCRVAIRHDHTPDFSYVNLGFRLARTRK